MKDLIERQSAIDTVIPAMVDGADAEMVEGLLCLVPPAQPERKKGKWIIDYLCSISGGTYKVLRCSICGHAEPWQMGQKPWQMGLNFCPNCGAKMEDSDG